jgi:drug/metabolite transporter (DMT)-like permease
VQIPWYVAALGAAMAWGVHYPLVDHALKRLSWVSVFVLTLLPLLVVAPLFHKQLAADFAVLRALDWSARAPILAIMLTSAAGAVLLFLSIAGKNATLAALIEISYPVFVVLFAWLLFGEYHLTPRVMLGAGLVFAGVLLIIWHNP